MFTGVIDKTTGSVGGQMRSTIIDAYDRFSAPVSHEPLLNVMPPASGGGDFRGTGLTHTYFVDVAFRAAGFFVTPKQEPNCLLHVPAQGTIWPHRGRCVTAGVRSGSASYPTNSYASWGFAVSNAQATYLPEGATITANDNIQMTMVVGAEHAGFAYLRVGYEGTWVQLAVNVDRKASIMLGETIVASVQLPPGDDVVQVLIKGYTFKLRSRSGGEATGVVAFGGQSIITTITLGADPDARVAGMQVSNPTTSFDEFRSVGFQPNAHINVSNVSLMGILRASPAIAGQTAAALLDEISSATLSCLWIDETGKAQWWPAAAIRSRNANRTITTADDILELNWEEDLLSSAARVSIKYKKHAVKLSKWPAVRVWQGSANQLESGDVTEDFAEPGADEAWVGVAETPTRLGGSNWDAYNKLRGSFVGVYYSADGQTSSAAGLVTDITMSKLGPNKYLIRHTAGTYPADVVANQSTSPIHTLLWDNRKGKPLPDIGAHAQVKWTDQTYSPSQVGGAGPELVHETGVWVPESTVPNVFDYLAGQTATPQPVITGMGIEPNLRLMLGDMINIRSTRYLGIELKALIVGMGRSHDSSGFSQSLDVRVVEAVKLTETYAEFSANMSGSQVTYAEWQQQGPVPPLSYTQFNTP
ncbi:hypothetical protein DQ353_00175 [Arthrobacter sp. AQ5-05]|nr:hypothetical protein DQ353_00175 [Arthrobacter sp. AQ5-05]